MLAESILTHWVFMLEQALALLDAEAFEVLTRHMTVRGI